MKQLLLTCIGSVSLCVSAAEIITVRLPDGAIQPRVVTSEDGKSDVVFLQGNPKTADVKVAALSSSGTLGEPVKINTATSQAVGMGTVRGPSIAIGAQHVRHVLWHGKMGSAADGKGSALWFVQVDAKGKPSAPMNLMGNTRALDGGAAITADSAGNVCAVWHALPAGKEGEAERRVFVRRSSDNGKTFSAPWTINGEDMGVCACCGLAAALQPGGSLHVLYRVAENKSQRGARLIRLRADATQGDPPELVQKDNWQMPGCPMTTAALLRSEESVVAAWVTQYQLRFWGWELPEKTANEKNAAQNHPRFVRNTAGETLLLWTEGAMWGKGGELVAQIISASGERVGGRRRQSCPLWSYGACASLPDGRFAMIY